MRTREKVLFAREIARGRIEPIRHVLALLDHPAHAIGMGTLILARVHVAASGIDDLPGFLTAVIADELVGFGLDGGAALGTATENSQASPG